MTHNAHLAVDLDLLGFLVLGLVGSLAHCVGMCAPFVMVVSRQYVVPTGRHAAMAAQLWYTAGRIVTYAMLGAMAASIGHVLDRAGAFMGIQRVAAAMAGAALVLWALATLLDRGGRGANGGALFARVARGLKGRLPPHPLLIGLFLGLLPCGLLYSAVIAAAPRGGPLEGATALAVFGAGTAPAMLGLSFADRVFSGNRPLLNRVSQAFVLVMGLWYLWRGFVA